MSEAPLLSVRGLHKSFGALHVLKGVDLAVRSGEVAFLIGPSGGGKSTLIRCINFLETPSSGEITFDGRPLCHEDGRIFHLAPERVLRAARSEMPMVFQHFNLFSHRTVLENVIEGPIMVKRRPRAEAIADAERLLREVGLHDKSDFYPDQLSGGQKQRVAIARALAMRPKLILFDEPTSALDPELVAGILDTIRALADRGMTLVVVSHEMAFARKLADVVHFIADGTIMESGPPDRIFDNPQNPRLSGFIRSILH
ncbi:amino acid ABC transporter ATP-binding protein [Ancylobacter rudongensis]|uniref:Polar amino acid transport system ATP-binding protein n=1 Tax=Ancylobacter rudongensis TaxID=177413 RepID=A0A1G4SXD9_9HYPH|nr:amino acid ABC transporter ATP-binding protein [Ancylobacter rudongensis]SCW73840.1 polar amino acid transport system ATP-binding protein [Ancylobacter rudongensis]